MLKNKKFDCVIVGAGPAGLTASVYLLRAGLSVCLVEKNHIGGQTATAGVMENIPGFDSIDGMDFVLAEHKKAESLGLETVYGQVLKIERDIDSPLRSEGFATTSPAASLNMTKGGFKVHTTEGIFECKAVILAMGAAARKLGLPKEEEFVGRGISYCVECDGNFFKDKDVVVLGGGNSAVEGALYLENLGCKVSLVHRSEFRADKVLLDKLKVESAKLKAGGGIEVYLNTAVVEILGKDKVEGVKVATAGIENRRGRAPARPAPKNLNCEGLFICIGRAADTEFVESMVELNNLGFIKTNENMETSVKGIFAAGDVRENKLKQVVVACSEGAIAAVGAIKHIRTIK